MNVLTHTVTLRLHLPTFRLRSSDVRRACLPYFWTSGAAALFLPTFHASATGGMPQQTSSAYARRLPLFARIYPAAGAARLLPRLHRVRYAHCQHPRLAY